MFTAGPVSSFGPQQFHGPRRLIRKGVRCNDRRCWMLNFDVYGPLWRRVPDIGRLPPERSGPHEVLDGYLYPPVEARRPEMFITMSVVRGI